MFDKLLQTTLATHITTDKTMKNLWLLRELSICHQITLRGCSKKYTKLQDAATRLHAELLVRPNPTFLIHFLPTYLLRVRYLVTSLPFPLTV